MFKSYETWKRNLVSYNIIMNKYLSVQQLVDRAKNLSDAELIIKLVSVSAGERISRDSRSEIYIPSEDKTSALLRKIKDCFKVSEFY